jgi:hypothetical protein
MYAKSFLWFCIGAIWFYMQPVNTVRTEMHLICRTADYVGKQVSGDSRVFRSYAFHGRDSGTRIQPAPQLQVRLRPTRFSGKQFGHRGYGISQNEYLRTLGLPATLRLNFRMRKWCRNCGRIIKDLRSSDHRMSSRVLTHKHCISNISVGLRVILPVLHVVNSELIQKRCSTRCPSFRQNPKVLLGANTGLSRNGSRLSSQIEPVKIPTSVEMGVHAGNGKYYLPVNCGNLALSINLPLAVITSEQNGSAIGRKYQILLREHPNYNRSAEDFLGTCEIGTNKKKHGHTQGGLRIHLDLIPSEGVAYTSIDGHENMKLELWGQQVALSFDGKRWFSPTGLKFMPRNKKGEGYPSPIPAASEIVQ